MLPNQQNIKSHAKTAFFSALVLSLTACQSVSSQSTTSPTTPASFQLTGEQPKNALSKAIEHTLLRNQDWIAEHQLYFVETPEIEEKEITGGILGCQKIHDDTLIAQMLHDHIKSYAQVAKLSAEQKKPYETIKQTYLKCYKDAESTLENSANKQIDNLATIEDTDENKATVDNIEKDKDDEINNTTTIPDVVNKINTADTLGKKNQNKKSVLDDIEPISEFKQTISVLGLNEGQIKSINNFVAKSGKIVTTGNYRPFSGYMATQIDVGFENKNLKYHYRLPLVSNWKTQAVYVKPDIIMPTIALYLDNKMGTDWQDKWYKFYPAESKKLPLSITGKNWLLAFKDSIKQLPAAQFEQVNPNALTPNIAYATQKIATNGTIIHWQQTNKDQQQLYHDIIERYITLMDNQIGEKTEKNANAYQTWQGYKQKLTKYMTEKLNSDNQEDSQTTTDQTLAQDMYFVITQGQVKQVFATHTSTLSGQPVKIQTWITFDPETKTIIKEDQPASLLKLARTIQDGGVNNNVLDGQKEIDRIVKLDKSRRLFGKDPQWLDVLKRLQKNREDKPADQDY